MTQSEFSSFLDNFCFNKPHIQITQIIIRKRRPKKKSSKRKNQNEKDQKKNFPKMIGNKFIAHVKNNELFENPSFFYEKAPDIAYPNNYKDALKKENFLKWINSIKKKQTFFTLVGFRKIFCYSKDKSFRVQHYKFVFKKIAKHYLQNFAIANIMKQSILNNVYGDAACKYIALVPKFLRYLESGNGFWNL